MGVGKSLNVSVKLSGLTCGGINIVVSLLL